MPEPDEILKAGGRLAGSVIKQLALLIARLGAIIAAVVIDDAPWTIGFGALLIMFGGIYAASRRTRDVICLALCGIGLVAGLLGPTGAAAVPVVMGLVVLVACFEVILGLLSMLS